MKESLLFCNKRAGKGAGSCADFPVRTLGCSKLRICFSFFRFSFLLLLFDFFFINGILLLRWGRLNKRLLLPTRILCRNPSGGHLCAQEQRASRQQANQKLFISKIWSGCITNTRLQFFKICMDPKKQTSERLWNALNEFLEHLYVKSVSALL